MSSLSTIYKQVGIKNLKKVVKDQPPNIETKTCFREFLMQVYYYYYNGCETCSMHIPTLMKAWPPAVGVCVCNA